MRRRARSLKGVPTVVHERRRCCNSAPERRSIELTQVQQLKRLPFSLWLFDLRNIGTRSSPRCRLLLISQD